MGNTPRSEEPFTTTSTFAQVSPAARGKVWDVRPQGAKPVIVTNRTTRTVYIKVNSNLPLDVVSVRASNHDFILPVGDMVDVSMGGQINVQTVQASADAMGDPEVDSIQISGWV